MTDENDYKIKPDYYGADKGEDLLGLYKKGLLDGLDSFESFCLGNSIKYLVRYKSKHGKNDLEKAKEYLDRVIEGNNKEIREFDSDYYGSKLNIFDEWYSKSNFFESEIENIVNIIIAYTMDNDVKKLKIAKEKIEELI